MKKDFESRFMPMVKFKIPVDCIKLFDFGMIYPAYALTSGDGDRLSTVCTENERSFFTHSCNRQVSIYEAMPELIPDGMRYNKELDKLVPDSISASKEYCSGVKVEIEKVVDYVKNDDFIKFNQDKIDFSLVDSFAYEDLGKCLTFGAKKYSKNNWIKGSLDIYISALERHLIEIKKAVQTGDKQFFIDNDSTLQHGGNLMCNAMFIHYFIRKELEKDVK